MKQLYVRTFGTDRDGRLIYEWTEHRESAPLFDEMHANLDCDLLNRFSPNSVTPEAEGQRLIFENYRVLEVKEGLFCIAFESRTEIERVIDVGAPLPS